ncbi:MAG TPA: arabinan endo-1,5-alpha-L-arabinosidase, partial [Polyangiaceae bacterium]|nr:arabinan endo-1,5-alpha-L-arabinosidase [Polyangiaceae bacterium]
PTTPAWFQERVPAYEPRNIWAPDISYFGGQYHLYYSVSSFGSNRSCIGHATRAALDSGAWDDHEAVFCSNAPGQTDNFNAIDPNVISDETGTPWMAFGSFWDGIKMIRLDLAGEREGPELVSLASRGGGAIEAPFIVRRCGYYYLFVSFDRCCQGADSTYNIRVGRSSALLGPYVDRDGRGMLNGGGTLLVEGGGDWVGPGHNAVLFDGPRAYNVYHAYAATNGASQLRISELVWDADGWPVSGGP